MAKSEHTKEKLLTIMDILRQETDEEHHLPLQGFLDRLAQKGIPAERKSLYRDFAVLEDYGWDILHDRAGYYLASDTFELPELKLLADAVQCARFITEKKSYELIGKLEDFFPWFVADSAFPGECAGNGGDGDTGSACKLFNGQSVFHVRIPPHEIPFFAVNLAETCRESKRKTENV